jgi:hypothetical protein
MTTTQGGETGGQPSRNLRPWIVIGLIVAVIIAVLGVAAVWIFFFGSEAPPAPTLDDALGVFGSAAPSPSQ